MGRLLVCASASLVVAIASRPASACACGPFGWFHVPSEAATDVPTNLAEIFIGGYGYAPSMDLRLGGGTESIPLGPPEPLWRGLDFQLRVPVLAPLAASTTYALLGSGSVLLTFTTAPGPDFAPPPALAFDNLEIARADMTPGQTTSCGSSTVGVRAAIASLGETPAVFVVKVDGLGFSEEYILRDPDDLRFFDNVDHCSLAIDVQQREVYCVEVRGRDLAGNLGPVATRCAVVRACEDFDHPSWPTHDELFTCPEAWPGTGSGCSTAPPSGGLVVVIAAWLAHRRRARRA